MACDGFSRLELVAVGVDEFGRQRSLSARRAGRALTACACVALVSMSVGCAGMKVTRIADEDDFQKVVMTSDKPVLVDFYKGGCATCIPLDGVMDKLVDEYEGRAVVAKFQTMTAFFGVPSPKLKAQYDIVFFPTVILFVNGQEKKRWIIRYSIESYEKALNEYVPPPTTQTAMREE